MQEFTNTSNGHVLTIKLDSSSLIAELDEDIKRMEDLKKEIAEKGEEIVAVEKGDDPDEYMGGYEYMADYRYDYDMQEVYGDYERDFCTPDEIITDRNNFKETIKKIIADNGSTLWGIVQLKKDGTFRKTSKPTIRTAINGRYLEDSYGWNTLVLRIVPHSDTVCHVELDHIVIH